MKRMWKDNTGFSLVELIIVIAIMAILIGVLAPQYIKYVEKSRTSADQDTADALLEASHAMIADEDFYAGISSGSKIEFNVNGISADNPSVSSALGEYYAPNYKEKKPVSKSYRQSTYEIVFSINAKNDFLLYDTWKYVLCTVDIDREETDKRIPGPGHTSEVDIHSSCNGFSPLPGFLSSGSDRYRHSRSCLSRSRREKPGSLI